MEKRAKNGSVTFVFGKHPFLATFLPVGVTTRQEEADVRSVLHDVSLLSDVVWEVGRLRRFRISATQDSGTITSHSSSYTE